MAGADPIALLDDLVDLVKKALPAKVRDSKTLEIIGKKDEIVESLIALKREKSTDIHAIVKEVIKAMKPEDSGVKTYAMAAQKLAPGLTNDQLQC